MQVIWQRETEEGCGCPWYLFLLLTGLVASLALLLGSLKKPAGELPMPMQFEFEGSQPRTPGAAYCYDGEVRDEQDCTETLIKWTVWL